MSDNNTNRLSKPILDQEAMSEGGLRPPPEFGRLRKLWWWFDFIILVKLARLRFIGILVVIGLAIVYWDTLHAYYDKWTRPAGGEQAASSDHEWFCPMHPSVVRDNPKEKCPICFMPLSKRKKGEASDEALPPGIVNRVQLSPYRVVLAGIQTWTVDYVPLTKKITTVGYVEFNERLQKQVAARVKGRIDSLAVSETGRMVHAGDVLASIYSPDLVVTVQNLLDAKRNNNADILSINGDRLRLWGISDDQIDEILRTNKANTHLKIRSPIDGHVIQKYVKEGQYVDEGMPLYDVADLSTVWIQAQIYEEDLAFLPPQEYFHNPTKDKKFDLEATATTRAFPNERFRGTLTFVQPHVDPDTRTVTVRFELDNPGHKLRPGTTATVELEVPPKQLASLQSAGPSDMLQRGLVLAVPESAVIDTGSQQIVYREAAPGEYEGVKVELGPRMVGPEGVTFYPVLRGLEPRNKIVTSGSFLVDAETRLNPAAGSIYFGGSGLNKPGQSSSVRPSTPDDEEANVKASIAKLPKEDQQMAAAQQYCPVNQGTRLGSMGPPVKVMIKGKPVFLC
jgi:RND family efflux transporter MFP subunit